MSPEFSEIAISLILIISYAAVLIMPLFALAWLVVCFWIIAIKADKRLIRLWRIVNYIMLGQLVLIDLILAYTIVGFSDLTRPPNPVNDPISLTIFATVSIVIFWISLEYVKRNKYEVGSLTLSTIVQLGIFLLLSFAILIQA